VLAVVALVFGALVAVGVRVPGGELARGIASRILCGAALGDGCGDEPAMVAAYGTEVGTLIRQHMPTLGFEGGSRAVPVDFRRCRGTGCGDGAEDGLVHRTRERLPVTAFVHVVDCRQGGAEDDGGAGVDCSGGRAGNLYLQYWLYFADSATLRDVPLAGERGYHADDWESVQVRIRSDGSVDQRASSHHGYNYFLSDVNWMSDAGVAAHDGWGPETRLLLVSGGSHAGNAAGFANVNRFTPGRRVHLVPLEQIAVETDARFAVSPPWLKQVWLDPEYAGTS
jgi:hypothetical protein